MTESAGAFLDKLLDIMARLRGPHGCPWDREQTRASLKPYLIEEAYEVLEAIEAGDDVAITEELGDVLLQVVFHSQLGVEQGAFAMTDVLARLNEKLVRRHPHVFGAAEATTVADVLTQWEALKRREREARGGEPPSALDGVPRAMPALIRAQRVQEKASRVKFDWPDAQSAFEKVEEEMRETRAALQAGDPTRVREELGDVLFSLVNVARLSALDAEDLVQSAVEKFRRRFMDMEAALSAQGRSVTAVGQDELERSWEAAKARERQA